MWNFSGRQNDIQGHGNVLKGNWISGIPFVDNARLGDQDQVPEHLKNNPGRNKYFMLPLLLGLVGLMFHYKQNKQDFAVVLMLYVLTGIAISFTLLRSSHIPFISLFSREFLDKYISYYSKNTNYCGQLFFQ